MSGASRMYDLAISETTSKCTSSPASVDSHSPAGTRGTPVQSGAAGFPVSRSAPPAPGDATAKSMTHTSGLKCYDSFVRAGRKSSFARTLLASKAWHSKRWFLTWKLAITPSSRLSRFRLVPSDAITGGRATGFVHTPTSTANLASPSMKKWPSCRDVIVSPESYAERMGYPPEWLDCAPSGTLSTRVSRPKSSRHALK